MEYSELKTLEELSKFGVNVDKIFQVKTPCFDPDTLEYNAEKPLKNCTVYTQWFWKETVEKINNYPKRVFWYAGNSLDIKEFNRPEFQQTGMYGAIRLCFETIRVHILSKEENTQVAVNGEIMFEGETRDVTNKVSGFLAALKFLNIGCTVIR